MTSWRDELIHRPSERPAITDEMAHEAADVLHQAVKGELPEETAHSQANAARWLLQLKQTQDRYTPEQIDRLAKMPKASQGVRDLDNLTDEELDRLRWEMAADYPGRKPKPS